MINKIKFFFSLQIDNMFYWECQKRRTASSCPARARSTRVNGEHKILGMTEHNHTPDPLSVKTTEFREKLKRKAEENGPSNSAKTIQTTLRDFPAAVQTRITYGAGRKIVHRVCSSKNPELTEPDTLEGFTLPDEYKRTVDGDQFLIEDIHDGSDRAFIFGSNESLRRLSESKYLVIDGTFKTVPCLFRQLVTIHGSIEPDQIGRAHV